VTELTRLGWHFRQTEMNAPPKSVVQKRRGRPPNPCINSVISLRLGADLELQLEDWRSLRPKPPNRSRAIRVLLRRALAVEKEREDGSSDQKTEEPQSSGA
jgi:hypothetical protein